MDEYVFMFAARQLRVFHAHHAAHSKMHRKRPTVVEVGHRIARPPAAAGERESYKTAFQKRLKARAQPREEHLYLGDAPALERPVERS